MENAPELMGRLLLLMLVAGPASFFLFRGLAGGPRSRKLADLALSCGVAILVMPEAVFGLSAVEWAGLFGVLGGLRVLLGLAGLFLALLAFAVRRDGGVTVVRPIVAAGFSLLHVMSGTGEAAMGWLATESSPWVYQSPDAAFRLTLPSQQWKRVPVADGRGVVAFACGVPRMQACVLNVVHGKTEADYTRDVEWLRARVTGLPDPLREARFRQGTSSVGNRYAYFTLIHHGTDGKPVFVAQSLVWCPEKQIVVEVYFEGLQRRISQMGKSFETELFEKSAETICLSVE